MALEQTFCPSPWLHMRIDHEGRYNYCRWSAKIKEPVTIADMGPIEYFQTQLQGFRQQLLDGDQLPGCAPCYEMEQHGKISGRQRQLLKIGVLSDRWLSMATSPWLPVFKDENLSQKLMPIDWQIDLGNYCNSACVFCQPKSSSRLAHEWQRIGFIESLPKSSWCEDPTLLDRFICDLVSISNLKYIHFIGGETLITPAFKTILSRLIENNVAKNVTLGFTTNLTEYDSDIIDLLGQFEQVNVGISVECFDNVNDYIRYPSQISNILEMAKRWVAIANQNKWLLQIRTTPTIFSINRLLSVYEFAWQHQIPVESCNFLQNPKFMKINLLPQEYRRPIIKQIQDWIETHKSTSESDLTLANTRNSEFFGLTLCRDLSAYCGYLENEPEQQDQWPRLIDFVKRLEAVRGNRIIDYLPEYEELFRIHGY